MNEKTVENTICFGNERFEPEPKCVYLCILIAAIASSPSINWYMCTNATHSYTNSPMHKKRTNQRSRFRLGIGRLADATNAYTRTQTCCSRGMHAYARDSGQKKGSIETVEKYSAFPEWMEEKCVFASDKIFAQ